MSPCSPVYLQRHEAMPRPCRAPRSPTRQVWVRSAPPCPRGSRPVSFRSLRRGSGLRAQSQAQPHLSSSPARDFTCRSSPAASDQASEGRAKAARTWEASPACPPCRAGCCALRGQSCLLHAAGRDPSASRPRAASLCLPSILESTSTQTKKQPGTGSC